MTDPYLFAEIVAALGFDTDGRSEAWIFDMPDDLEPWADQREQESDGQ